MIRREFAQKNPEVYLPSVAETLGNLAVLDRSHSQLDEARLASEEALTIYQDFAKQASEQFSPDVRRVKKLLEQLPNITEVIVSMLSRLFNDVGSCMPQKVRELVRDSTKSGVSVPGHRLSADYR